MTFHRRHLAALLSISLAALGGIGCSDDETTPSATPEQDSGADVTQDVSQDTGNDVAVDTAADTTKPETSTDTGTVDSAPDATDSAVTDSAADSTDAPVDAGMPSGEFQVLTLNDWHGQIDPISETDAKKVVGLYGGVAYLSAYFKKDRAENPNTIILSGGDDFGGSPTLSTYGSDTPEEPAVKSLDYLGLTAGCLGNHNFDRGTAHLKKLTTLVNYNYIATNLTNTAAELGDKVLLPYKMVELGATEPKIKVAIIGISNPETPSIVFAGSMGTITVKEPVAAANNAAAAARAAGAHAVVVASHLGVTGKATDGSGNPTGPLVDFVKSLSGVDFVLGGHTDLVANIKIGDVQVMQGLGRGRNYGKTKITVKNGKVTGFTAVDVEPVGLLTAPVVGDAGTCPTAQCPTDFTCSAANKCEKVVQAPDADVVAFLKPFRDNMAVKFDGTIGKVDAVMVRDGTLERTKEMPIGDLVADAILDTYKPLGAQIAFMNGGGLRASLPSSYVPKTTGLVRTGCSVATPCDLVLGDIYTVMPFGNAAVLRKVTGKQLWAVLEMSVFALPAAHGRFLQVAGLNYTFKLSGAPGARVQSVTLVDGNKNIPVDDTTEYSIVVNDFMNLGGDGYTMLIEPVTTISLGILADAVVAKVKAATGPLTTPAGGRITILN